MTTEQLVQLMSEPRKKKITPERTKRKIGERLRRLYEDHPEKRIEMGLKTKSIWNEKKRKEHSLLMKEVFRDPKMKSRVKKCPNRVLEQGTGCP